MNHPGIRCNKLKIQCYSSGLTAIDGYSITTYPGHIIRLSGLMTYCWPAKWWWCHGKVNHHSTEEGLGHNLSRAYDGAIWKVLRGLSHGVIANSLVNNRSPDHSACWSDMDRLWYCSHQSKSIQMTRVKMTTELHILICEPWFHSNFCTDITKHQLAFCICVRKHIILLPLFVWIHEERSAECKWYRNFKKGCTHMASLLKFRWY